MSLSFANLRHALSAGLLGDAQDEDAARPAPMLDMLSAYLPYRVYDPTARLYLNARSAGFISECW